MRIVDHLTPDGPDKILHIRSVGCDVNIIIGTHHPDGTPFTTIEVLPHEPDDDGVRWENIGSSNVVVSPAPSDADHGPTHGKLLR
ncbi:hypothetical protein [Nocardia jiangxiensis]|uniref:Uncharacterized protein n=1 Tax=Nocardia jiangxiensis TaxID=282685 RepID=A0ABW6S8Z9_9NOCA|nr:hypothetical protein [Nocardia jiangxiensis]